MADKRGHGGRPVAPAREQIVAAVPVFLDAARVPPDVALLEPAEFVFDGVLAAFERALTDAGQAGIGLDFDEEQVPPAQTDLVDLKAGDLDSARGSGGE